MSSFGAKPILRRDIVTKDIWFQNNSKICEYLESRCDSRKSYFNLDAKIIDEKQLTKGFKIERCMSQDIFDYVPNSTTVPTREYSYNCEEYLQLNFSSCLKGLQEVDMVKTEGEENLTVNTELEAENDSELDDDID